MAFHDVRFPLPLRQGAKGGPEFRTLVVGSEAGLEQRAGLWSSPRRSYEFDTQTWSRATLDQLLAFFVARAGRLHSFRFRDWSDYFAGRRVSPGVYDTPMRFGTGTGSQTAFQLTKTYSSGGVDVVRVITKPVASTVKVFVGGVEQTSGWTLNASTGVVTFSVAPANGAAVAWTGEFDVHARFDMDRLEFALGTVDAGAASVRIIEVRE